MDSKRSDEQYSEEETAKRRDEVLRRMLNTPPKPHHPTNEAHQRKARPASKGRGRKGKARS